MIETTIFNILISSVFVLVLLAVISLILSVHQKETYEKIKTKITSIYLCGICLLIEALIFFLIQNQILFGLSAIIAIILFSGVDEVKSELEE